MAGRIALKCMACHSTSSKVAVEGGVRSKGQRLHRQVDRDFKALWEYASANPAYVNR